MVPLLIKATSPLTVLTTQSGGLYGLICLKGSLTKRMYIFFPPYIFLAFFAFLFFLDLNKSKKEKSLIYRLLFMLDPRSVMYFPFFDAPTQLRP